MQLYGIQPNDMMTIALATIGHRVRGAGWRVMFRRGGRRGSIRCGRCAGSRQGRALPEARESTNARRASSSVTLRTMSKIPNFVNESDEADWWASRAGREYVKKKAAAAQSEGKTVSGSSLVAKMNRKRSKPHP